MLQRNAHTDTDAEADVMSTKLASYLKLHTMVCEPTHGILRAMSGKERSSELLVPPRIISGQSLNIVMCQASKQAYK